MQTLHGILVSSTRVQARTQKLRNNKNTIETVYWGYSGGPFDETLQPTKRIKELDPGRNTPAANGLQSAWFKATSAAFARLSRGKTFLIYDGDWKTAKGGDGRDSIFLTNGKKCLL